MLKFNELVRLVVVYVDDDDDDLTLKRNNNNNVLMLRCYYISRFGLNSVTTSSWQLPLFAVAVDDVLLMD